MSKVEVPSNDVRKVVLESLLTMRRVLEYYANVANYPASGKGGVYADKGASARRVLDMLEKL